VANQRIVVRTVHLPPLEDAKEIEAAVRFQAQEHIPMPLEQAVLEHQSLGLVETGKGQRTRVVLVAARRDMIERLLAATRKAGLRPQGIDLAAFAMIRALHREAAGEAPEPVLYLSVGGLTNLAVARGTTCLFTRASGGGVEALAIELAETAQLTLEHARGWLEHVGLQRPIEEIEGDEAIVATARRVLLDGVRRIAADVRNSLDFHLAQGGDGRVGRAVLTGPASAIPGFDVALSSELGLPVTIGGVAGDTLGLAPGRLAVAAGLAIEEAVA
jgi:type IV pilus assembly protein PilM